MKRCLRLPALAIVAATCLLVTGCLATQVPVARFGFVSLPGFWKGLWHGIIAPVSFIISLFSDTYRVYAVPNNGRWYDFGFMVGIGGFSHGLRSTSQRQRRKTRSSESSG